MNAEVFQALLAANIPHREAVRLANALEAAYTPATPAAAAQVAATTAATAAPRTSSVQQAVTQPLLISNGLISKNGGQFAGDNTFLGPVDFQGKVFWGGEERAPAVVDVVSLMSGSGNTLRIGRIKVAALNAYGDAEGGAMTFSVGGASTLQVVTDVTCGEDGSLSVTKATITTAGTGSVNIQAG